MLLHITIQFLLATFLLSLFFLFLLPLLLLLASQLQLQLRTPLKSQQLLLLLLLLCLLRQLCYTPSPFLPLFLLLQTLRFTLTYLSLHIPLLQQVMVAASHEA
jgi:hypothetical protein